MNTPNESPGCILIVRLSSIGDVVRTLPALASLRREYPNAHIAWAVEDKSCSILENHPQLDEIIILPRKQIVESLRNPLRLHRALSLLLQFRRKIRHGGYDLVFDFHGFFKSGLIAAFSHSRNRVGYTREFVKEFDYLFTNRKVALSDARLPRVERNLELIKQFVSPGNITDKPVLGLTEAHREKAKAFVQEKFGDSHPIIAVHPGTSRDLKKWPLHSHARLCDMLSDSLGARAMLTWGPGELDEVEEIRSMAASDPEIGMRTDNLLELAALFETCDLLVTVDSGPMHIGSAVGTPVVAVFGPTDTKINAPYWQPSRVVSCDMGCAPCDEKCDYPKCMEAVTPEEVLDAVRELL